MEKSEIVNQAVGAIQSGIVQVMNDAVGAAVDQAVANLAPAPAGFTQADIDSAVTSAVAAAKAEMQAKLDELTAKEASEEQKLEAIKALLAN